MSVIISNIFLVSFLSFLIPFFYGKHIGSNGAVFFVAGNTFLLYSCSIILLIYSYLTDNVVHEYVYNWISVDLVDIQLGFLVDSTALVMFFPITFISLIAQIYSYEYLYTDPHLPRYYSLLGLFTFFMIFLVFSADFIQFFFAWEGVGICSYLLINSWYFRCQSSKASILAILVNKVGDVAFLIGFCMLYSIFFSTNIDFITKCSEYIFSLYEFDNDIFMLVDNIHINEYLLSMFFISCSGINLVLLELGCFFLFIACCGKSAQFIFHIWLPEAMEGPTPVSSLLHAATMVTLGVFLILRMSFLFSEMPSLLVCMVIIGTATVVSASISSTMQEDSKKTIAYSTCSQLGYMFIGCGLGDHVNVIFQLFLHAFFKALLFLLAGYVIYLSSSDQDSRETDCDPNTFPLVYSLSAIGTIASMGISPTGASFSKEFLLEFASCSSSNAHEYLSLFAVHILDYIPFYCTLITTFYSLQGFFASVWETDIDDSRSATNSIIEPPVLLTIPLLILAMYSLFAGYFLSEIFSTNYSFFSETLPDFNDFDEIESYACINQDFLFVSSLKVNQNYWIDTLLSDLKSVSASDTIDFRAYDNTVLKNISLYNMDATPCIHKITHYMDRVDSSIGTVQVLEPQNLSFESKLIIYERLHEFKPWQQSSYSCRIPGWYTYPLVDNPKYIDHYLVQNNLPDLQPMSFESRHRMYERLRASKPIRLFSLHQIPKGYPYPLVYNPQYIEPLVHILLDSFEKSLLHRYSSIVESDIQAIIPADSEKTVILPENESVQIFTPIAEESTKATITEDSAKPTTTPEEDTKQISNKVSSTNFFPDENITALLKMLTPIRLDYESMPISLEYESISIGTDLLLDKVCVTLDYSSVPKITIGVNDLYTQFNGAIPQQASEMEFKLITPYSSHLYIIELDYKYTSFGILFNDFYELPYINAILEFIISMNTNDLFIETFFDSSFYIDNYKKVLALGTPIELHNHYYQLYGTGFSNTSSAYVDSPVLEFSIVEYYDSTAEAAVFLTFLLMVPICIIYNFLTCDDFSTENCDDEFDSFTDEFFVLDIFYNRSYLYFYIYNFLNYCYDSVSKIFDKGLLEFLFGFGFFKKIRTLFYKYFYIETGYLYHSPGVLIITLTFFIFIFFQ